MRQKLSLLLLMALFAVGGVNATEYDLSLSSLSGKTYNSSTYECNFGTKWDENQWWIGNESPLDISSYGEFVVEYSGATAAAKYRVYLEPASGTTQTVQVTANQTIGRNIIKLADGLGSLKKIVISDAGTAFNMTLTRAFFRSKSSASTTELWTGTTALGNWTDITALTSDGDGKTALKSAKIDDVIRVTFTNAASDNQINVRNSSYTDLMDGSFSGFTVQEDAQTAEYVIPNAEILESIQLNGLIVSGKNATVTKIELVTYTESYDAVAATIGTDGIATFSTGSKKLDFTSTGVTPYYASAVARGTVTLTAVADKTTWGYQGYILQGAAGTYEVPVITEGGTYLDTDYLKATGDYSANIYRSAYSEYSDGDSSNDEKTSTDEYKIKNYYRYIFAKNGSDIGFYKLATDYSRTVDANTVYYHVLNAHKAYLETPDDITPTANARVALIFDNSEPTAIKNVNEWNTEDFIYYNLNGVRVQNPTKGLYIVNGKKVLVR